MRAGAKIFRHQALILLGLMLATPGLAQWQDLTIDTLTADGVRKACGLQSLDLDFLGFSHAAWRHRTDSGTYVIKYATDSPDGIWRTPVTVSDSNQNSSIPVIAVSPTGDIPYIGYISGDSVYIAYPEDQDWLIELVAASEMGFYSSTIAIDETDLIHMAWIARLADPAGYKIVYAAGAEGQWSAQILEESYLGDYGSGASPYIDVTAVGRAHILYRGGDYGQYHIHHACNDSPGGDNWQYEIVYSGNINDFSAALVIDSENTLHAVMSGNDGWGFPSRSYYSCKEEGDFWQTAELLSLQEAGTTPSIDLDIQGRPHAAWMGISGNILTGYIYYSYKDESGIWQDQQLIGNDHFEPCLRVGHFGTGKMICVTGGNTSDYDVFQINGDVATAIDDDFDFQSPLSAYKLWQNYPNPFNEETAIVFSIPRAGLVNLSVYDILGKKVTTLVDEYMQAGDHELRWDSSRIATGIYFYRLEFERISLKKKAILLK